MYAKYFKRPLDLVLSSVALVVLSPIMLLLIISGAIAMKGNPFFVQKRPGMIDKKTGQERIISLFKFRSMTNECDENGNLLPDSVRLNKYGRFLRSTSLDELPSLLNIINGSLAIVGPRPLAVQYLPFYTERERLRHSVRPGLTGLAQVNGRNCINWPQRFAYDLTYVENITFAVDMKIIYQTAVKVVKRSDVTVRATGKVIDFDKYRMLENEEKQKHENVFVNE